MLQKQNQNVSGKAGFYEEFEVRKTKTAVVSIVLVNRKVPCTCITILLILCFASVCD